MTYPVVLCVLVAMLAFTPAKQLLEAASRRLSRKRFVGGASGTEKGGKHGVDLRSARGGELAEVGKT